MIKLIDFLLVVVTTFLLVVTQILLKIWLQKYSIQVFPVRNLSLNSIINFEIGGALISFIIGGLIWLDLLKKVEFNILYPLISISYIFGLLAAKIIFNENVPTIRWIGVGVIILGIYLISKSN